MNMILLPHDFTFFSNKILFHFSYKSSVGIWIFLVGLAANIFDVLLFQEFLEQGLEVLLQILDLFLHTRIPVVLDSVIGSSFEHFCDNSPLVCLVTILKVKNPFFLSSPWGASLDVWIQMVMPSFSALFADSSGKMVCYWSPFLWTINVY